MNILIPPDISLWFYVIQNCSCYHMLLIPDICCSPAGSRLSRFAAVSWVWCILLQAAARGQAHVKLCVLALMIQRAAENATDMTWKQIQAALESIKAVEITTSGYY